MNKIRESMERISASRELKTDTLRYLEQQRGKRSRPVWCRVPAYGLAAALCLVLLAGVGWHRVYGTPISYISMDVNPSIELGINRYGRVVAAEAYNADGQYVLQRLSLQNVPYVQAVSNLLEDVAYRGYLKGDATLVFTIISDSPEAIREGLEAIDTGEFYNVQTYTSDRHCMEEAHQHHMSFGKYRAYLELTEYDQSVTLEDCHEMSMGEIQNRIEGCRQHGEGHGGDHGWHGYTGQENYNVNQGDGLNQNGYGAGQESAPDQRDSGTVQEDGTGPGGGTVQEDGTGPGGGTVQEDGTSPGGGVDQKDSTGQDNGGQSGHHGGHHHR